jgi:kynurenine formamidase
MSDLLLDAVAKGTRIFDLAQPLHPKLPNVATHPGFRFSLMRRHGDVVRGDGISTANEMIVMGGHTGTHIDALSHVSCHGHLHGGIPAADAQGFAGFKCLGIDELEPVVARGVLLDVCADHGVSRLPNAHPITPEELRAAADRAGTRIQEGDVVLVRTGWGQLYGDPEAFIAEGRGVPGPNEDAARWLAEQGIRMTGSDTMAYEQIPAVRPDALPGHRVLIFEHGINIIEILDLEPLAEAGCSEFVFVLAPLKIVGGTASPARPIAVVSA